MKNKTGSIIFSVILSLFFFTLGAVVTIWVKKSKDFTVSHEISITDAISIVFTIILTIFVAYYVERTKDIKRITKDMFISYYKTYLDLLKTKIALIIDEQFHSKKTLHFKLIRTHLNNLIRISIERKIIKKDNDQIKKLFLEVTELWRISTVNPVISEDGKEKIELLLIKVEGIIYELTFEINEN